MESEGVQEGRQALHKTQDADSERCPHCEHKVEHDYADRRVACEAHAQQHRPHDLGQLCFVN